MFYIWSGVGFSKEKVGDDSDREKYICMNIGSENYHLSGTTCAYEGVKVPFLVEFSEGGGISGHIIMNVLRYLYALKSYQNDR